MENHFVEINYPKNLPITERKDEIVEAIQNNQIVIITGETGSGKTTQIPKMCFDAGLGRAAKIGCTQPRRLAATSLARQIAKELNSDVGELVGYKIRFSDQTSNNTVIKLMTDGILLAEIQSDPLLLQYDCIIIDEAHERSLNIDFLLGYLRQLLPKRNDLKLIVTSATFEVEKFAQAFSSVDISNSTENKKLQINPAPIIEVSGRTYPVEERYHPVDELREERGELSVLDLVKDAVEEVLTESDFGDVLIFLSGEKEIKEVENHLKYLEREDCVILPLYARLTAKRQNLIFTAQRQRKIILSTNIAETSLTIPGIRYVVDTGLARISRYNQRTGTLRLPVEPIAKSSAKQRAGRCGRVSNGVCIRLYSEQDYLSRPDYTPPEIQRSNLTDVILRMKAFKLGDIHEFPFIDPPDSVGVRAAFRTLVELGALNTQRKITRLGRQMAFFPVDPRTARMIFQARDEGVLHSVLILAAAISSRDPREFSDEDKQKAQQLHAPFRSKESDLLTLLNLWNHYQQTKEKIKTQTKLRKFCKKNFLNFSRMREWIDLHAQLLSIVEDKGWSVDSEKPFDYAAVHRSILAGFITNIAQKKEKKVYQGTRNQEVVLFPASDQYSRKHEWIVALELIETSRLFAHRVAKIDPAWLERLGGSLCKKSWSNPHWEKDNQRVVAMEKVTLLGLVIVPTRKVNYGRINRTEANEIFVRSALVEGELVSKLPFYLHNCELIEQIKEREEKTRKRDLLVDDEVIYQFYLDKIKDVACIQDLTKLINEQGGDSFLRMEEKDLLIRDVEPLEDLFPETMTIGKKTCQLSYIFNPGETDDGVTIDVPASIINALQPESFELLVPGLLKDKILWLLKNLPKTQRRKLVPIPEKAELIWDDFTAADWETGKEKKSTVPTEFYQRLSDSLFKISRVNISPDEWEKDQLPDYLKMNFRTKDLKTGKLVTSRNLEELIPGGKLKKKDPWDKLARKHQKIDVSSWDFDNLLEEVPLTSDESDIPLWGYRTLQNENGKLVLTLAKTKEKAEELSRKGVALLLEREFSEDISWIEHELRFSALAVQGYLNLAASEGDLTLISTFSFNKDKRNNNVSLASQKSLRKHSFEAIKNYLFFQFENPIVSSKAFQKRIDKVKLEIKIIALRTVDQIEAIFKAHSELMSCLWNYDNGRKLQSGESEVLASVRQELGILMPPNFLAGISWTQLRHIPRYLKGYQKRAERAMLNPDKILEKLDELEDYSQIYLELRKEKRMSWKKQQLLDEFFWMQEEYKISLFAQELKTAYPISAKRLDKALDKINSIE